MKVITKGSIFIIVPWYCVVGTRVHLRLQQRALFL